MQAHTSYNCRLEALLIDDTPLIDLRAPAEFARGALPAAVNLPLLSDTERAEVGTLYKQQGRDAAVRRGHELVSGATRQRRLRRWRAFAEQHPDAWLCCWRGGLRSATVRGWLADAGFSLSSVPGGYKQLRQLCLTVLDGVQQRPDASLETRQPSRWLILGGRTGVGKTDLLATLAQALDLEQLAKHRGSTFGALPEPQPTPATFENALAVRYLQHKHDLLVLEDESRTIGRLALPLAWHARMQQAPVVVLEDSLANRVARIRRTYVDAPLTEGATAEALQTRLENALGLIRKRLGAQRHHAIGKALAQAFRNGCHEAWIESLLRDYYDPMYDYQIAKKQDRILFSGEWHTVSVFLNQTQAADLPMAGLAEGS